MKIRVFQSDKGDCLLLQTAKGANLLIDGGMPDAYSEHVAPFLGKMQKAGEKLDLVYVSHIDQDHIGGVLRMLNDLMDWRVYDFQKKHGGGIKPKSPRPPDIDQIWHNAFSALLKDNQRPAEELLAQMAMLPVPDDVAVAQEECAMLAQSVKEAIQVSQRISPGQLDIALNKQFDGQLIMVREPAGHEVSFGGVKLSVIGPFAEDVDILKNDWNKWLQANKASVRKLLDQADADAGNLQQSLLQLSLQSDIALGRLGDRTKVTPPNLASVMLLAEEGGKSMLLTGDGHRDDILAGLDFHGRLDAKGCVHVDVLKYQHHGSEHNTDADFCLRVTADSYIFCGNGKHENPDLEVLKVLLDTQASIPSRKKFRLFFNSSSKAAPAGAPKQHMQAVEKLVGKFVHDHPGLVSAKFLEQSSFELAI